MILLVFLRSEWWAAGSFEFETKMEGLLIFKSASLSCSPQKSSSPLPLGAREESHLQASPLAPAIDVAAVPPPPPPPPPLPPPPPPMPPQLPPTPFGTCDVQRRSMKKLNWDTIPSHSVVGKLNVWTSQRPQRQLVLDIQAMEELFSHTDKRASIRSSRLMGMRKTDGMELSSQEAQVTNNVGRKA